MNRHLPLVLLAIVSVTQLSCAGQGDSPKEWAVELERGYTEKRGDELDAFLDDWLKHSSPSPAEFLNRKPKFEQAVYRLYQAFFQPAEFYRDTKYIVIQDKVNVYIVDSDFRGLKDVESWKSVDVVHKAPVISQIQVRQFRPSLTFPKRKIVYVQDDYLAPMLGFLTQDNGGYAMLDRYAQEECVSEERQRRLKYLNSRLKIVPGHWGTGWHFETHPRITAVYFSADLKQAVVSYREYYGGGEAIMNATQNGQWKVIAREDTWVE